MLCRSSRAAIGLVVLVVVCGGIHVVSAQPSSTDQQFPPGFVRGVADLPESALRQEVESLPLVARERAAAWLGNLHFTSGDLNTMRVDSRGGIFYADPPPVGLNEFNAVDPGEVVQAEAAIPVEPFPPSLKFHSRPGAPNVLYLNFAGEVVEDTAWNNSVGRSSIPAVPFSKDSDFSTFSDSEQLAIRRIWQRVSEDFAPFDIDVTTERPGSFGPYTAHALITRNTDANGSNNPSASAGGVAYVGVFGRASYTTYRPAWVYANNLAGDDSYIAEAVSHEIGHNLGLSHDGTTSGADYYSGHGSGETSWGPIMGTPYNRNVTQWSKGEYYRANNTQDDLATIAGKLAYRGDDHGNSGGAATALTVLGGTNISSSNPESDPDNFSPVNKGVINDAADVDVFTFVTGTGDIELRVEPWISPSGRTRGGNLDIHLELRTANGALIEVQDPDQETAAEIRRQVSEGIYQLHVRNSATGSPLNSSPTGYPLYGSVGQYFISGTLVSSDIVVPPGAVVLANDIVASLEGAYVFQVEYSDNVGLEVGSIL